MTFDQTYWPFFERFGELLVEQRDYDPTYDVIKERVRDTSRERRLWYVVCYVAWYSLTVGEHVFQLTENNFSKILEIDLDYPTKVNRRNLRGGLMKRHVQSMMTVIADYGGLERWLTDEFDSDWERNCHRCQESVREVWGNGVWAGYKIAEILEKSLGYPIRFTDVGDDGHFISPTPRKALELFYGPLDRSNCRECAENFFERCKHIHEDVAVIESILCWFYRCATGRQYPGSVTDGMLHAMTRSEHDMSALYAARKCLPAFGLGELNGWDSIDEQRLKAFYHGKVILRRTDPVPELPEVPWKIPFNW